MGIKAGSGKGSVDAGGSKKEVPGGVGSSNRRKRPSFPPPPPKKPLQPDQNPFPEKKDFRLGQYRVLEERDDYLLCTGFDPNAKNPFSEVTPSAFRTGSLLKIAKPPALQRTIWEAGPVDIGGTEYTFEYEDDEFGVRTASWTDSNGDDQEEEQRISLPYLVGDILIAVQIRKSAAVDGMEVEDEEGTRLRWIDLNVSGRHWAVPSTAQMIRFTIISATSESAAVTIDTVGCGGSFTSPASATVHDAVGCFLNEDAGDLVDRQGYAIKMKDGDDCRYEIISLCCPPD
jgi:hypothetical protein